MEIYDAGTNTWTELLDNGPEYRRSFGVVTVRRAGMGEEQDLFDSLIDQATRRIL
jgi:hypothetical protein